MSAAHPFLAVAGSIGSGKTTLTENQEDLIVLTPTSRPAPASKAPQVQVAYETLPASAKIVMQCLMDGPLHIDELSRRTSIAISDLSAVLWLLFERDLVKETGVLQFSIVGNP